MADIEIRHRQGRFTLDASFSLPGAWTVIFGPSGAGKTTLLRVLAGLSCPTSGRIRFEGRTLLDTAANIDVPAGKRSIGFVTQQPALFPHLTARQNIAFGIQHLDRDRRTARVDEMLQLFGAESLADQPAPQLSGGERKRVALARALAPAPDLLLLDEPLAGLDDTSAHDILARLLSLQGSAQVRIAYVSHDLAEIWRLPAEVVCLESGCVTAVGPLQQVLASHRDRLLQQLRPPS
ncbi:MAG TPA: ATP-binding cassette domain-containing protein [Acidobacteriaceae bacterium]|nr:ATP-binding cassette domain-containing protein [Acidobacteriaceae bacterium]